METINVLISVAAILGAVGVLVWLFIWDLRSKRALKETDDQWDRALKELHRQAAERKRKKEGKDGTQ